MGAGTWKPEKYSMNLKRNDKAAKTRSEMVSISCDLVAFLDELAGSAGMPLSNPGIADQIGAKMIWLAILAVDQNVTAALLYHLSASDILMNSDAFWDAFVEAASFHPSSITQSTLVQVLISLVEPELDLFLRCSKGSKELEESRVVSALIRIVAIEEHGVWIRAIVEHFEREDPEYRRFVRMVLRSRKI